MRLAIIGYTGQLARALKARTDAKNIQSTYYNRSDLDLTDPPQIVEAFIEQLDVDAVIIAAAYTAVDKAESDKDNAYKANATTPEIIAKICARKNIALIHISTDYVFDGLGQNGPYTHLSPTSPINIYGSSKRSGEISVLKYHKQAAVLRTSWVFDGIGANFMTTMLRLGAIKDSLNVVADQIGRPTYAGHLADAILIMLPSVISGKASGLYHVTGGGNPISWANFARAIFELSNDQRQHHVNVTDIPTTSYPTPAKRPAYSVLNLHRYESAFTALPDWQSGLKLAYNEWLSSNS